ncbi:Lon protease 1, partial [Mycoplasma putrefaciens]
MNELIYQLVDKAIYIPLVDKIKMLSATSLEEKLDVLENILKQRTSPVQPTKPNTANSEALSVESEINKKLKDKMDKQQKEYYLREKMRIIKEELDDEDSEKNQLEKYKKRLEKEPFPENVKEKILSSIRRVEAMQPGSSEANVERNYIDW